MIGVAFILFMLLASAASTVRDIAHNAEKKTVISENEAVNLAAIQSGLFDYTGLEHGFYYDKSFIESIPIDSGTAPDRVSSFALLRYRVWSWGDGTMDWRLSFSVPDGGKTRWSSDELDSIDVLVLAVSDYQTGLYRKGAESGEATSESVQLYYYNPGTDTFFKTSRIEGKELQKSESRWHHEIDDSAIINRAEKEMKYADSNNDSSAADIVAVAFIGYYVLGAIVRKITRKRKARA